MIRKLQFYREGGSDKHLRDISRMLAGLGDDWPRETIHDLLGQYGLRKEWEMVQASD